MDTLPRSALAVFQGTLCSPLVSLGKSLVRPFLLWDLVGPRRISLPGPGNWWMVTCEIQGCVHGALPSQSVWGCLTWAPSALWLSCTCRV